MNIAIKPVTAHLIRQMAEKYPDLTPYELAKQGGWDYGRVASALRYGEPDKRKPRAS